MDWLFQPSFDAIGSEARGIVVVSVEQALRSFLDNKRISVDCLALLTLAVAQPPAECALHALDLTWPGVHQDTQDPFVSWLLHSTWRRQSCSYA